MVVTCDVICIGSVTPHLMQERGHFFLSSGFDNGPCSSLVGESKHSTSDYLAKYILNSEYA
jgi:hypothetical protein